MCDRVYGPPSTIKGVTGCSCRYKESLCLFHLDPFRSLLWCLRGADEEPRSPPRPGRIGGPEIVQDSRYLRLRHRNLGNNTQYKDDTPGGPEKSGPSRTPGVPRPRTRVCPHSFGASRSLRLLPLETGRVIVGPSFDPPRRPTTHPLSS